MEFDDDLQPQQPITIHVQIRRGKKHITTLYGLPAAYDPNTILDHLKAQFHCGGNITQSGEFGDVIVLSGDHGIAVHDFLVVEGIATGTTIILRGLSQQ